MLVCVSFLAHPLLYSTEGGLGNLDERCASRRRTDHFLSWLSCPMWIAVSAASLRLEIHRAQRYYMLGGTLFATDSIFATRF